MIVAATYSELLASGHIVPCEVLAPKRTLSAKQILTSPVDAYLAKTPGTQALCFAPHVKAATDYAQEFRDNGVAAAVVEATTPTHIRDHTIKLYLQRKIQVICNVAVLTEGTDLPLTETIIMARNCGSAGLFIQITGRGGRPSPGKDHYTLLDLCGVTHVHGSPTEDRVYSLEGVGIRLARAMPANVGATCKVCSSEPDENGRCPSCGHDASLQMPKVVGSVDDLKPWQKALQGKSVDERAVMLGKWWTAGRLKGHKDGAAMYRYKGSFKHFPPADVR
jgi:superfamily II DNA or RNA helicase